MSDIVLAAIITSIAAVVVALINWMSSSKLQSAPPWTKLGIIVGVIALVLALLPIVRGDTGDSGKQLVRVGDVQICWGTESQKSIDAPILDRKVSISYREECKFLSPPHLTTSVHVTNSQGTTWAAYESKQTVKSVELVLRGTNAGIANSTDDRFKEGEVRVEYVAVGRWR